MPLSLLAQPEQLLSPSVTDDELAGLHEIEIEENEEPLTITKVKEETSYKLRTPTVFPSLHNNYQQIWDDLVGKINENYHEIDIEAIRIAMAAGIAQRQKKEVPIWLFVLGASGTGKSLIPAILSNLPEYHMLNSITPNTLLSGMPKAKGGESLLLSIGKPEDRSALLVFPDFSTVISRKAESVSTIAGDLREVFDGHLRKDTGMGKPLSWKGKITIIAMCTPDLERLWGPMRGLGERFVQVRWGRSDGIEQAKMAYKQIGREEAIKEAVSDIAKDFYLTSTMLFDAGEILDPIEHGVAHLAEITSLLRTGAARDDRTKKLEDMSEPEGNTRFFKAIVQVARSHAAMFRREMIVEDYQLAARVAIDSIPMNRLLVVRAIPDTFEEMGCSANDLVVKVGKPKTTVMRCVEELEMLGILSVDRSGDDGNWVEFSKKFKDMKERAKLLWH